MKKWLILIGLCLLPSLVLATGEDGKVTVDGTFDFFGNTPRDHNVRLNVSNPVLLSSAPERAVLDSDTNTVIGIGSWRFREIINVSTCSALALYHTNKPPYNVFSSTYGVVLSSDSKGLGAGDVYEVPHQDEVWGIWTFASGNGSCLDGAGAVVTEVYQHPNRKR